MGHFFDIIKNFFKSKKTDSESGKKSRRLEPKYWQEVIDFREHLEKIIKENTIDADNVNSVNERVVDYLVEQINQKGSLPTIEERYKALNTLADRILLNYSTKIVGLKSSETTKTDFTDVVNTFKIRLREREQKELSQTDHETPL